MRASVAERYTDFTIKFEGKLPFMYLDVKNLVTTGIGNLIDPIGAALSLPWKNKDGTRATEAQIRQAWNTVKARTDLSQKGGVIFGGLTTIRLDNEGIKEVVNRKLLQNEEILRKRFKGYDAWPADAQLGLLSMAWAMGPHFKFPKFEAAVNQLLPDFKLAAQHARIGTKGNPGVIPRNEANLTLFTNAAKIVKQGLDFDKLHWPEILPDIKKAAPWGVGLVAAGGLAYFAYTKTKGP